MDYINRREMLGLGLASATTLPFLSSCSGRESVAPSNRSSDKNAAGIFDLLPVGPVRPEGWLLRQLQHQAAGVTSHLQHLYAPFNGTAWIADETDPSVQWWPWEVRGYWCDGTLRCGLLLDDTTLIEQTSALIKWTFDHPQSDGYLGPTAFREAGEANRWPHAVFFRAAMAWHDATGDATLVERLENHYLGSKFDYVPDRAATNIEAMLWTYERSGNERLRQLALDSWTRSQEFLAKNPGSFGLTERSMLSPGPCGEVHGVTYAELSKLPALLYRATGEDHFLKIAVGAQQKIFDHHLLVGGVPSTSEVISSVSSRDAHEVCNAVDYPWTWGYLAMVTGDGSYGDRIERVMFNGLPGSLRKDWKALQYFSSPNQFICISHSSHLAAMKGVAPQALEEFRYLQRMSYRPSPGHTVVCCPGNLARALPNYIARMWMVDSRGHGLAATLYGPCRLKWQAGPENTPVEIEERTTYPYSEAIEFHVQPASDVEFPLHLRIPTWCARPGLQLNGRAEHMPEVRRGFITLRRTWRRGDVIRLALPMNITTSRWPEDGLAVERGPLVYAHAITGSWSVVPDERSSPEFPAYDLAPRGAWNYALLPENESRKPVHSEESPSDDPWTTPPSSISIEAQLLRDWDLVKTSVAGQPAVLTPRLPDPATIQTQATGSSVTLKLVPYASTELRVSIFPRLKLEPK